LSGIPTQAHADEVKAIMAARFSASSVSSITAARQHWERVYEKWGWQNEIETGDPHRGAKLVCFVLALMAYEREPNVFYPSSTIGNYVWALCAYMQQLLHADPRTNVVGWRFFMASVVVMCYVPYEPRRRVPTAAIRSALAAVDVTRFDMVQMAVYVLFLYFTFQRSEFPSPKTYDGLDFAKHLLVKHMEPHEGGFRWAVGSTKADPRAERLSADAGAGREWIIVGEVDDPLFDIRVWLQHFYSFFPEGPRDPDSPFFVCTADLKRPLIYRNALADFRQFLTGHIDDPSTVGLHGIRSEGFVVCSNAVGEEAAVMQGGWRGLVSASRYDRLTHAVQMSMAKDMVAWCNPSPDGAAPSGPSGSSGSVGNLGIVAKRAAAKISRSSGGSSRSRNAATTAASVPTSGPKAALPPGWRRVWHATPGKRGGYASFVGPNGRHARSIAHAQALAAPPAVPARPASRTAGAVPRVQASSSSSRITVGNLVDHVTEFDRPPTRRAPAARPFP